jgi:membrane protein implicated in regulation of membrane protease activity
MSEQGPTGLAEAIQEVSEKAQLLIREEIELAKAEVQAKANRLLRGVVVAAAAGGFVLGAALLILQGLAWLAYYSFSIGNEYAFFWGFFIVAGILLLLAAVAGFVAYRAIRSSTPPAPQMAIEEAKLIQRTVTSDEPTKVGAP